jgi:hypothetical protein
MLRVYSRACARILPLFLPRPGCFLLNAQHRVDAHFFGQKQQQLIRLVFPGKTDLPPFPSPSEVADLLF